MDKDEIEKEMRFREWRVNFWEEHRMLPGLEDMIDNYRMGEMS